MNTGFNEALPLSHGDHTQMQGDQAQIWIIGSRDQVIQLMNEFYVRRIASDRVKFTPIVPAPFAVGKFMTVLVR